MHFSSRLAFLSLILLTGGALAEAPNYLDTQSGCEYSYAGQMTFAEGQRACNEKGSEWWLLGDIVYDADNATAYAGDPCSIRQVKGIAERIFASDLGKALPWVPDSDHAKRQSFFAQKARVRGYEVLYGYNHYIAGGTEWYVTLDGGEHSQNVASALCVRKAQ